MNDGKLSVYANSVTEWVIAYSVDDAIAVLRESVAASGIGDEECDFEFVVVPDDKILTMDGVAKTAAEWANGMRGFLGSTEY